MAKSIKTYIFCYDDYRSFSEDVKKRFPDPSRYIVISFQTRQEFLDHLQNERENPCCKVAILGIHDSKEQLEMIDKLSLEIRKIDPKTGIILLTPVDKLEEVRKTVKFNIDAYIPWNTNAILRIHNIIKKLISENSLVWFRKRRTVSLTILFVFVILSLLLIVICRFRFPGYF